MQERSLPPRAPTFLQRFRLRLPIVKQTGDYSGGERILRLSLLAVLVGSVAALMGWVLLKLIAFVINAAYYGQWSFVHHSIPNHLAWTLILVPVVGGLVVGLMARYGSRQIRGHGIPEAMEAVLEKESRIPPRVAWLKPLASAVSIGTGGPFGAEGPIIMTGGALGSVFAQLLDLNPAERKTLLAAGAAAGMTVIFGTPAAAVLMAVELLLFEWKPRSLVPVAVASVIAQFWRPFLIGPGAMFPMPESALLPLSGILWCIAAGVVAGLLAMGLTQLVYFFERQFEKNPVHWMWWPALGGIFVGLGGWLDPRALGVGYHNIRALLNARLSRAAAAKLLVTKGLVWSLALGSGTAGGVLAPLVMVGGAAGLLLGGWIPVGTPGLWALLVMAGVMGCAMRAPLTAALFGFEVTGNAHALVALLLVCMVAHLVGVLFQERSIMTERLALRGHDVRQELTQDPFEIRRAGDFVRARAVGTRETSDPDREKSVAPETAVDERALLSEVIEMMERRGICKVPVVARDGGALLGDIDRDDLIAFYAKVRTADRKRSRILAWKR